MKSIIEYFCPLCIAPIVNAIGGETGNARVTKDTNKEETNHNTRNIVIGVIIAVLVLAMIIFVFYRSRSSSASTFSPAFEKFASPPLSSCGCGLS
jgi:large-conductance mechanosensitive channel